MTLDEAIRHAEEVAEGQEKVAKEWHEGQVRKCELIPFAEMDYTHENECKKCAEEHRQLAEWLKELKQLREQTRWVSVSERLPEDSENYLIADSNYINGQYYKISWFYPSNKKWSYRNADVIAWMPLPKPMKLTLK
ncbi:MAG TPA: hypothetical protein DCL29_05405 [Eubacterium sp.]|nr:hypothetical protein [Eubacterium sp.]